MSEVKYTYVKNKGGAVHQVTEEEAKRLVETEGFEIVDGPDDADVTPATPGEAQHPSDNAAPVSAGADSTRGEDEKDLGHDNNPADKYEGGEGSAADNPQKNPEDKRANPGNRNTSPGPGAPEGATGGSDAQPADADHPGDATERVDAGDETPADDAPKTDEPKTDDAPKQEDPEASETAGAPAGEPGSSAPTQETPEEKKANDDAKKSGGRGLNFLKGNKQ